jgi:hypothetical protein
LHSVLRGQLLHCDFLAICHFTLVNPVSQTLVIQVQDYLPPNQNIRRFRLLA